MAKTGRPRKYDTAEEAAEANRRKSRDRARAKRLIQNEWDAIGRELLPPCCRDYVAGNPSRRKVCPQHRDWKRFTGQSVKPRAWPDAARDVADMMASGHGVSARHDDSIIMSKEDKRQQRELERLELQFNSMVRNGSAAHCWALIIVLAGIKS